MRISIRHLLVSFALFSVLFSLMMALVGSSVFDRRVEVVKKTTVSDDLILPVADFRENLILYCFDPDRSELSFAVLVRVEDREKKIILTDFEGDLLVNYENSLYFLSTLGKDRLSSIVFASTGIRVGNDRLIDVAPFLLNITEEKTIRYNDLLEIMPRILTDSSEAIFGRSIDFLGYTVEQNRLVVRQLDGQSVVDSAQTILKFQNSNQ